MPIRIKHKSQFDSKYRRRFRYRRWPNFWRLELGPIDIFKWKHYKFWSGKIKDEYRHLIGYKFGIICDDYIPLYKWDGCCGKTLTDRYCHVCGKNYGKV